MSALSPRRRRALLAAGLVVSAVVGSALGRAYQDAEAPPDETPSAPQVDAEVLAEALDLELPPAPRPGGRDVVPDADGGTPIPGRARRTGQAALRSRLPLPPRAGALVSIGNELDAHGVPMNLATFETDAPWKDVLAFYARHFESKRWPYSDVRHARGLVPYPSLSATLVEEGLQLTVMVMPHGDDKGSSVVLGLADMRAWSDGTRAEDTGDLPVYPGTHPLAVRSSGEGRTALTVSFDTKDTPATVEAFYRRALGERGYTEVPEDDLPGEQPPGPRMLRFTGREGGQWSLALSAREQGTVVTAQGSAPAQPPGGRP
ncbi:hypothetical protein HPC49_19340 [Pyxidicoccus fallax]|uniref:Uncharacterized protein n=1 Tax=Pyxidicoccus fallax TaxID=394095 RepID=A0A848LBV1_9BACT|nr:hypothetical protein [Pyxidicoccus fallax]NMO14183.1 hypothetical protein [Pyxidicoccus fallax]NPC80367.1 hypothetical protein [Pyxidicoccus fallax]